MRVIAGQYGGLRLEAVKGDQTRPTTDKIKEAMFSMLMPYLKGGNVLDLYAGTGGLAIEAVSRGMDQAVLVDRQYQAVKVIQDNLNRVGDLDKFDLIKANAQQALGRLAQEGRSFDLVLLDPPYAKERIQKDFAQMAELGLLNDGAILLVESDQAADLPEDSDQFALIKQKHYGITVVTLYQYQKEGNRS